MRRPRLVLLLCVFGWAWPLLTVVAAGEPFPIAQIAAVGGPIARPVLRKAVNPVYPEEALKARVEGVVIVEITVQADGRVIDPVVVRPVPQLNQAALDAVVQWEYEPVLVNGAAIPVRMTVPVNFALPDASGPPAVRLGMTSGTRGLTPGISSSPPGSFERTYLPRAGRAPIRMGRPDGIDDVYEISDERAAGLPQWDSSAGLEPPLSIGAAILAARTWVQQKQTSPGNLDLFDVRIDRAFGNASPPSTLWVYRVQFRSAGAPPPGIWNAIVLLDGSVVEPRQEQRAR